MPPPTKPYTFDNNPLNTNPIDAVQVNADLDTLYAALAAGQIDLTQLAIGAVPNAAATGSVSLTTNATTDVVSVTFTPVRACLAVILGHWEAYPTGSFTGMQLVGNILVDGVLRGQTGVEVPDSNSRQAGATSFWLSPLTVAAHTIKLQAHVDPNPPAPVTVQGWMVYVLLPA